MLEFWYYSYMLNTLDKFGGAVIVGELAERQSELWSSPGQKYTLTSCSRSVSPMHAEGSEDGYMKIQRALTTGLRA